MRHNFVDWPIELRYHQSAGLQKCCMKPLQSLIARLSVPTQLVTCGFTRTSCLHTATHLCCVFLCVLLHGFLSKRESTRCLIIIIIIYINLHLIDIVKSTTKIPPQGDEWCLCWNYFYMYFVVERQPYIFTQWPFQFFWSSYDLIA